MPSLLSHPSDLFGIHYTTKHVGKMEGIPSLSTSCLLNSHCKKRMQNGNNYVCSKCYAKHFLAYRKSLRENIEENHEILTTRLIPYECIPVTNTQYFRFEAYGELENHLQLENYFNICRKNPCTTFSLWTKNLWIVDELLRKTEKPCNLIIIQSSPKLNVKTYPVYPFVDKVFTVYTKDYIKKNDVSVNCQKKCLECLKCYDRKYDDIVYISEILK